MTGRVRDFIMDPAQTGKLGEVVADGGFYGMQTFDQALLKAVMADKVDREVAFEAATSPHDFKLMLEAQGQRASGIEQVMAPADDPAAPTTPAVPAPENGAGVGI